MTPSNRHFTVLVIASCMSCGGCISFSGPDDVRNAICAASGVHLESQGGVSLGPMGVMLATMVVGDEVPGLGSVSSVSFGEYRLSPGPDGSCDLCLRELELEDWEPVVRMREAGQEMLLVIGTEPGVRRMAVVNREGDEVQIVKAKANFEKLLEEFLSDDGLLWEMGPDWQP